MLIRIHQGFKTIKRYPLETLILLFLFGLGMMVRWDLRPWISGDYINFLKPWMQQIVNQGGWSSLGNRIGDYTPAYVYLLTLLSYFPQSGSNDPYLYGIKLISIGFDLTLLIGVYLNASLYRKQGHPLYPWLIALIVFWLPTVVINGALWGQIDASYVAFSLFALYALQKNHPLSASIWYGIAISFKLQAIFFLPVFIIIFWFRYRWKIYYVIFVPLVYYIIAIPAFIAGRSFADISSIYLDQSQSYPWLTLNMPNLYQWFPAQRYEELTTFALGLFVGVMAVSFLIMLFHQVKPRHDQVFLLAVWSVMMANFFLPSMHERYLFGADVLVILLVWQKPKYFLMAIAIQAISFFAYTPFIFGIEPIPHQTVAIGFALALIIVNLWLWQSLITKPELPADTI
jgi:Gpi18-like mannosyltransferase